MDIELIYNLSENHIDNLLELYHEESWSKNRSLEDVKRMLQTSWIIGIKDKKTDRLIAFSRVLTDYVFRAFIYDVIVAKDYRKLGLGKLIINSILNHENLKNVERIELNCIDSNVAFYQKLGFDRVPEGTNMMRYYR
jgi:ribosomal protein S18 acetylase RimI-like enzyme